MKVFLIILPIFLISCSSNIKNNWTCPILKGGKGNCVSISEADFEIYNSMSGSKSSFDYSKTKQKIEINLVAPKVSELKKLQRSGEFKIKKGDSFNQKLRTKEKIGRVWFAPYIDSQGYQHSSSIIYVIDEKAKWIVKND